MKNSHKSPKPSACDLELPDWSGMVSSGNRLPVEVVFLLCEEYVRYFPEAAAERRKRRRYDEFPPFEL